MIVGIFALGFCGKYLYTLAGSIRAMAIKVDKLDTTIGHDQGNPIAHYNILMKLADELREFRQDSEVHVSRAEKHYNHVENLDAQPKYLDCDVSRCVHLVTVINEIKKVAEKFEQFEQRATDSRTLTGGSLDDIRAEMKGLATEVSQQSKQMVEVLTRLLLSGGKSK
jgi:hypothetical protein